jgi:hypothetical protein
MISESKMDIKELFSTLSKAVEKHGVDKVNTHLSELKTTPDKKLILSMIVQETTQIYKIKREDFERKKHDTIANCRKLTVVVAHLMLSPRISNKEISRQVNCSNAFISKILNEYHGMSARIPYHKQFMDQVEKVISKLNTKIQNLTDNNEKSS